MSLTRTAVEALWTRLLDAPLAPEDDFFDAGADSVMALAAQLELEGILGRKVSTCRLMEAPTVEGWTAAFNDPGRSSNCA